MDWAALCLAGIFSDAPGARGLNEPADAGVGLVLSDMAS